MKYMIAILYHAKSLLVDQNVFEYFTLTWDCLDYHLCVFSCVLITSTNLWRRHIDRNIFIQNIKFSKNNSVKSVSEKLMLFLLTSFFLILTIFEQLIKPLCFHQNASIRIEYRQRWPAKRFLPFLLILCNFYDLIKHSGCVGIAV